MKFSVVVTSYVDVDLDARKFTPEFLAEFRESFYPFTTIEEHAEHLAQLAARGIYSGFASEFIDGYGAAKDMGIQLHVSSVDTEVEETDPDA